MVSLTWASTLCLGKIGFEDIVTELHIEMGRPEMCKKARVSIKTEPVKMIALTNPLFVRSNID